MNQAAPSPIKKLSLPQQFELISRAISREGPQGLPEFPVRLHVVEHARGEPVIYEELPGQVLQRRPEEFVAQQILIYASRIIGRGKFPFEARAAKNCAHYWRYHAQRLTSDILPVAQLSEIGFTYHRLPWDFVEGPSPTWDEMFSRLGNADSVMAYIGSFFVPNSDRQQYCWIHGAGGDGKGALNRFLKKVFNGAYKPETVPHKGDKFWTSNLLNARVVVFGDCNNYNFPTSGIFKQITGDDPIKVEFKGENAFSAELVCKLLFLSNERPNITGQRSDVRRAIFSEMAPVIGNVIPTKIYDAMLWREAAQFLYRCLAKYLLLCPENGVIPVKEDSVNQLVSDNEEELEMVTLRNFEIEPEPAKDAKPIDENKRWYVSPSRLHALLDEMKIFGDRRRAYLEFLNRRFKVAKKRVKVDGQVNRRYVGFRESPDRPVTGVFGTVNRG